MFEILSPTAVRIGGVTFTNASGAKVISYTGRESAMRGVHLHFPNGFVLSAQWGTGNYCAARYEDGFPMDSADAEIAVWHQSGTCDFLCDPLGWVTAPEVLALIPVLMGLNPDERNIFVATWITRLIPA